MKKKKTNLTWFIVGIIVLAGIFLLLGSIFGKKKGIAVADLNIAELKKGELVNSISVKGDVKSTDQKNIYSYVNLKVNKVNVSVGDNVTAGQKLMDLDTDDLSLNIASQKADLSVAEKNSLTQLQNNQRIYNEASNNLASGNNTQLLNAENSLKSAGISLNNAKEKYQNALSDQSADSNTQIITAKTNVENAKTDLDEQQRVYENKKVLVESGVIAQEEFTQAENNYKNAQTKYEDVMKNLEALKSDEGRNIDELKRALDTAQTNYDNTQKTLAALNQTTKQELSNYENNVRLSEISSNVDSKLLGIQKLENQLADANVTAPINGTITAVYAKEGGMANGLMFVVEDIDHLKIETKIKEYDIVKVQPGMEVVIKSDATGDDTYEGKLIAIEPAALKNAVGDTDTTGDIEYQADVDVSSKETKLRVGMNAKLTIIMEKRENVFSVPIDAVVTEPDGKSSLYYLEEGEKEGVIKKMDVTLGLETDFYIEVQGEQLKEDMKIIADPSNVKENQTVLLKEAK